MADLEEKNLRVWSYKNRMAQVMLDGNAKYVAPSGEEFEDDGGEERDFLAAPDLQSIAARLIEECEELAHLRDKNVLLLWKREGGTKGGLGVLGKCVRASGLVEHFANADWIIWVAADHVANSEFTRRQVEALCHHELLHAGETENDKGEKRPMVMQHDWEGFSHEVKRYGAWDDRLAQCKSLWKQSKLFE